MIQVLLSRRAHGCSRKIVKPLLFVMALPSQMDIPGNYEVGGLLVDEGMKERWGEREEYIGM